MRELQIVVKRVSDTLDALPTTAEDHFRSTLPAGFPALKETRGHVRSKHLLKSRVRNSHGP